MPRTPGPGDPETWGPPTSHPNDPRNDDHCDYCENEGIDGCDPSIHPEPDYEAYGPWIR